MSRRTAAPQIMPPGLHSPHQCQWDPQHHHNKACRYGAGGKTKLLLMRA